MKTLIFPAILFLISQTIAQDNIYRFDSYSLSIDSTSIKAYLTDSLLFYSRNFYNIEKDFIDLNSDGIDELVITSKELDGDKLFYTVYVYNLIDTFYLADSIYSGRFEPYTVFSEDIESIVIASGMPGFDSLIISDSIFSLPVNYWKYENGSLFIANALIYDLFMAKNEELITMIEDYYKTNGNTCNTTQNLKSVIASVYVNYLSAGEKVIASQMIKKYYLCPDVGNFKSRLVKILNNQI